MKTTLFIFLIIICETAIAQSQEFQIEAKIVDNGNNPISDVYVINFRNHDKNITLANGIVKAKVLPSDSLLINCKLPRKPDSLKVDKKVIILNC
jgi:hypothetical protein